MNNKINFYRDKPDLIVKVSEDDIINITGSVGSGKSTLGRTYIDKDYIVIGFDSLNSDRDPKTINKYVLESRKILIKKYKEISGNKMKYYNDIVEFIKKENKKGIIEGGDIALTEDIKDLKGTVIVKRTGRLKCYYRSAYRDFKNPTWREGLNKWGLFKRFLHCFKRRFHHTLHQKHIEDFISRLKQFGLENKEDN